MEQRRIEGKSHWYHETQSSTYPHDVLPLVPEAAHVDDSFLLDLAAKVNNTGCPPHDVAGNGIHQNTPERCHSEEHEQG